MPNTRVPAQLVTVLILALVLAGCAGSPADPAPTTLDRTEPVEPGGFVEANLAMDAQAGIAYDWTVEGGTEVRFDVHGHEDGEVRVYREGRGSSGSGSFHAPSNGTFSLLWENPASHPVTVAFHVEGSFELVSVTR